MNEEQFFTKVLRMVLQEDSPAEILSELRSMLGLSREQMAPLCGTTVSNYHKWETGRVTPNAEGLLSAFRALYRSQSIAPSSITGLKTYDFPEVWHEVGMPWHDFERYLMERTEDTSQWGKLVDDPDHGEQWVLRDVEIRELTPDEQWAYSLLYASLEEGTNRFESDARVLLGWSRELGEGDRLYVNERIAEAVAQSKGIILPRNSSERMNKHYIYVFGTWIRDIGEPNFLEALTTDETERSDWVGPCSQVIDTVKRHQGVRKIEFHENAEDGLWSEFLVVDHALLFNSELIDEFIEAFAKFFKS